MYFPFIFFLGGVDSTVDLRSGNTRSFVEIAMSSAYHGVADNL